MLGHKLSERLSSEFSVWKTIQGEIRKYEKFKIFQPENTFENVNILDENQVRTIIDKVKPDVVVNAVGIIKQVSDSKDVVRTLSVNSIFPHRLADLTEEFNSRLITFSTDCVYSGAKGNYTEEEAPDALRRIWFGCRRRANSSNISDCFGHTGSERSFRRRGNFFRAGKRKGFSPKNR